MKLVSWRRGDRSLAAFVFLFLSLLGLAAAVQPPTSPARYAIGPAPEWVRFLEVPAPGAPAGGAGGVDTLLLDVQVDVGLESVYRRVARRILNETGVQEFGKLEVSVDPSYQTLTFHEVKISRGGRVLDQLNPGQIRELEQEDESFRHIYDGHVSIVVFLHDLRAGDVVEYA